MIAMPEHRTQSSESGVHTATGKPVSVSPVDQRLGRYRLFFEIASGGMATVYLARTDGYSGFDKMVALKRIHPHLAKEKSFVEMFLDEARIAARINHPNVCGVFDFGETNGQYYIAMEYLAGEPLSRVLKAIWHRPEIKDSPKLYAYAARIVADSCEGLHAAHDLRDASGEFLNVVHRDVSPHNLFLTYDGSVRVVDFGIASARNRLHHTSAGEVKGKFAYMAPEQLRGKGVDRRADVWSLGVVLWEMTTMKRLFRRKTEMETIFAVASEAIPRASSVRPQIPAELDDIIAKALTREPEQRYQNARELGKDLLKFLSRSGEVIGPADLAEWMENLFPEGVVQKRELLERARHMDDQPVAVTPLSVGQAGEKTGSDVMSAVGSSVMRRIEDEMQRAATTKARRKWLMLATAALIGTGLLWAGFNSANRPEQPAGSKPSAVPSLPQVPQQVNSKVNKASESSGGVPKPTAVATDPSKTKAADGEVFGNETPPKQTPNAGSRSTRKRTREPKAPVAAALPRVQNKPTPTVTATGIVNIATPGGWAYVYEKGKRLGQTPTRLTLPVGSHVLEIKPFGEPPSQQVTVQVTANEIAKVSIRIGG